METIRNYLETMFSSLPNTDQVLRARDELYGMMEDKFTALLEEGMAEEEAVATVIAEFGSLEEIASELGIDDAVHQASSSPVRMLSFEEAEAYLADCFHATRRRAFGAAMIAASGACVPLVRSVCNYLYGSKQYPFQIMNEIGTLAMFALIALGVGMIIMASTFRQPWAFLAHENCQLDYPALLSVDNHYQSEQRGILSRFAFGTGLCILALLPRFAISGHSWRQLWGSYSSLYSGISLLVAAIGVYFLFCAAGRKFSFDHILSLNGKDTVGGNQFLSQKQLHFKEPLVEDIMSVYWQTVLCLYLCWSFLTFSWLRNWVIWPAALLVHWMIRRFFEEGGEHL